MKKSIMIFSLVLLLVGCAKESFDSIESDNILKSQKTLSMYVLQDADGQMNYVLKDIILLEAEKPRAESEEKLAFIDHAHGQFNLFGSTGFYVEFKSTNFTNGTGGGARLVQEIAPGLVADMTMETACLYVEGNEAIYSGVFIDGFNPFPPGGPFDLGNTVYFKVIDNGAAGIDQHYGLFAITPGEVTCEDLLLINWIESGIIDVLPGDQIKVKTF